MGQIYLARHGTHALVDQVLMGRTDAGGLSEAGFEQARAIAKTLAQVGVSRVQCSPRRRCRETGMLVATALGVPLAVEPMLDELDFGRWSGRTFAELEADDRWRRWNSERSGVRPPGGETAQEAQARIFAHIQNTRQRYPGKAVLMVTHAELIRSVLLACKKMPLDSWSHVAVAPGGVVCVDDQPERIAS